MSSCEMNARFSLRTLRFCAQGGSDDKTALQFSNYCARSVFARIPGFGKELLGTGQRARTEHDISGIRVRKEESERSATRDFLSELGPQWICHRLCGRRSSGHDGI